MNSGISVYRVCGAPFSESNQTEVRAFYCRSTFTLTGEPAIQGSQKKTLRKFNRLLCIPNLAKQFNFYIGRKGCYL